MKIYYGMKHIDKFEIKVIDENVNKYLVNLIQVYDENVVCHGLSFDKDELFELYLKLKDIFSE